MGRWQMILPVNTLRDRATQITLYFQISLHFSSDLVFHTSMGDAESLRFTAALRDAFSLSVVQVPLHLDPEKASGVLRRSGHAQTRFGI